MRLTLLPFQNKKIWLPPDEALLEASAGGERMIAKIRLGYYIVLSLVPVISYLATPSPKIEIKVSLIVVSVTILLCAGILLIINQGIRISYIALLTTIYDILILNGILIVIAMSGRPHVAANSQFFWGIYILLIVLTSLRFDLRLCAFAGIAAAVSYSLVIFWIVTTWDVIALGAHDPVYSGFSWFTQLGRVLLMLVAMALSAGIIIQTRRLIYISGTDRLTGIGNRAYLDENLSAEVSRSGRHGGIFSLAFLDLDHFKQFNDKWGHATGDEALVAVANVLKKESRREDIIARWGGEEFIMIMPGTNAKEAVMQLERIRTSLRNVRLMGTDGKEVLTLSGGIAEYPADGNSQADIISTGDKRMLQAKQNGRDQIVLA